MKHLLYIILLSLLFFSACKSQAEQKQQEANDTIVVETPKIIQDAPLVAGSVTLKDGDFGELIELAATHQILDEEGPIFKMSEPEMLIKDGYFLLQNRPAMSYTRRPDGTVEVVKPADEGLNCFFHWYRLPDFRYITSFGIGGNGPNEFNFPHLVPSGVSAPGTYVYETGTMQLFETDTTGVLRAFPFTFKSIKGASYSDRQICAVSRDTFYYADNVPRGKAIIRTVYQGDSLQTEQIYNLAFSKKHRSWSPYIGDFMTPFISGEFTVSDIKRANYSELFPSEEEAADRWFKCKLVFITLDEKSGAEKKTSTQVLVQAADLRDAVKKLDEGMKGTMADYQIALVSETPLMDVYPYSAEPNDKPEV